MKKLNIKKIISIVFVFVCILSICGISVSAKGPLYYYNDIGLWSTNKNIKLGIGEELKISYCALDSNRDADNMVVYGGTAFDSKAYGSDCASIHSVINAPKAKRTFRSNGSFVLRGDKKGENDLIGIINNKYVKNIKNIINGKGNADKAWYFHVDVYDAPKQITLSKTKITLKKGDDYTLIPLINKGSYCNDENITWTSNSPKIANAVSAKSNKIQALNKGTCYITAKTYNGKTAKCKVIVK